MKKFFVLCFLTMLLGCKQDDTERYLILYEYPNITIDDSKVHLKWNPVPYHYHLGTGEYLEPNKVDIYISKNDMSNFQKLIELNYDKEGSYTIDKLQNSSPYYFYVVAKRKGLESRYSDTIMVIPNKRKEFEILQKIDVETNISNISISHQKNKIAYVDAQLLSFPLFISNMDGSEKELVNVKSFSPSWSPTKDKIVFHSNGNQDVTWRYAQIAMYDCETKSITQLTDDNYHNCFPVFSKNGELLLFHSCFTSITYGANIYLMNLTTLESSQITDISKTAIKKIGGVYWIDNDRFLFDGEYSYGKKRLFESSVSEKQITQIFESIWNDGAPSISPDQKKIAFLSNRSGMSQVWIYHTDSKTFSQITGYSDSETYYKSESATSNIEWLDNSTIVFTINDIDLVKQRVE